MNYYLFAILDNILCAVTIMVVVGAIMSILLFAVILQTAGDYDKTDHNRYVKMGKWLYPVWIVFILLGTFIPNQKQMAFIIAAPYIIENQQLQEAGKNSTEIIKLGTEYLKNLLEEKNHD